MEGFNITPNTEIEVISPNLDYFLHLAEIQGVPEDLLFFRLYLKSITANRRWPIYVQNDDGEFLGCTIYDGTLTRLHKSWSEYQKAHPGFYVSEIRKNIDDIEFHLTESRCACPTKNKPILKELESFARDYPNLKVTLKIRNRIKEIKNKKGPSLGCENLG
jgi:hypothetical protein